MMGDDEAALLKMINGSLPRCERAGTAIDALPDDAAVAGILSSATENKSDPPLDAFFKLGLDDEFDNRDEAERPLGFAFWGEVLYFSL